jgi:hypothetical protein
MVVVDSEEPERKYCIHKKYSLAPSLFPSPFPCFWLEEEGEDGSSTRKESIIPKSSCLKKWPVP